MLTATSAAVSPVLGLLTAMLLSSLSSLSSDASQLAGNDHECSGLQNPVFAMLLSSLSMTTHNSDASQLACWPVVPALDTMSFSVRAKNVLIPSCTSMSFRVALCMDISPWQPFAWILVLSLVSLAHWFFHWLHWFFLAVCYHSVVRCALCSGSRLAAALCVVL